MVAGLFLLIGEKIISPTPETLGENEEVVQSLISEVPYIAFLMTTIFAPFIEEMIFRKSLQDCFKNKTLYKKSTKFKWKCTNCGHESELTEAWKKCPLCGMPQGMVLIVIDESPKGTVLPL
ncbi:rubredoxin-like domain-containing protein [uncultured Methanobrevibacter sp.]|uniref:rubredoxin-like domain-containing protein n=1 Tax=uncultured Methanobrevibacter sp. TaxID=253161 RepID=UPI002615411A